MKEINTSYLDTPSPADREVRFFAADDDPAVMLMELDTLPSGTIRLRMTLSEAKKLAVRLFTAAKRIGGELTERAQAH